MHHQFHFIPTLLFCSFIFTARAQFTYISPMPDSKLHNKETNIILRTGRNIDPASLKSDLVSISGSSSGFHSAIMKLAADQKTILINPSPVFSGGETVTVMVKDGIRNAGGETVNGTTFQFQIHPDRTKEQEDAMNAAAHEFELNEFGSADAGATNQKPETLCDELPPFVITSTPGAYDDEPVFYRNHGLPLSTSCYHMSIISSQGDSIFDLHNDDWGFDFKINDNGYLTYYNRIDSTYDMLDSSYNLVKKFYMGNGYNTDLHDFRIFPDGYHLMICFDKEIVDMTPYGGVANATVAGAVIQELDPNDNVIFQWRSWDHFLLTDAAPDVILTNFFVDYVHTNSMELDTDGNLLISSRNFDEITKIDLSTGDIIWRMGGENNQFTFVGDTSTPKPFSHQHHFRRLPNGHYTMFDNGNFQTTLASTAREFALDQTNKIATLVWSYQHPQVNGFYVAGSALGSVEQLPNGHRFIDWGQLTNYTLADIPNFTEIDSNNNIVWEFRFVDSFFVSYRAYKLPWDRCNLIADSSLFADSITAVSVQLHWNDNSKFSGFILQYKECSSSSWISIPLSTNFYELAGLDMNTCYDWRVASICSIYNDSSYTAIHQFTTSNPVGIAEVIIAIPFFTLYPNPATAETALSFMSETSGNAEVTIYNLFGGIIRSEVVAMHEGMNNIRLMLTMSAGAYTVELKTNGGLSRRQLVVH